MRFKCENCRKIVEMGELADRKKYKCPNCGRKGIYIPLAEPEKEGFDGVLIQR